jgi:spermidine/putrescine transport system permease protein
MNNRFSSRILSVWSAVVVAFLFAPIFVVVLFSFNEPGRVRPDGGWQTGRYNYKWGRFSLDAWTGLNRYPELREAFTRSIRIALLVVLISTVLGTLMSLALVKYRFSGKGVINMLLVLPLTMPEIVLGFSLLTLFVSANVSRGLLTIVISHVMFCVSYITTTVKARIRGFDWRLEEAAADLGANAWRTFTRVTLPLIAPGIAAAALLTFALSLDDFIITYLNSGRVETFPIKIWLTKRSSIPPQINVFGTIILFVCVALSASGLIAGRRKEATLRKVR